MAQALPFVAAAGSIVQGVGGLKAGNANARAAEEQAGEERRASAAKRRRVRTDARRAIGTQIAALSSGGFEGAGSGGTALDAVRESQIEAALDALELRRQGALKARSLERQADLSRMQGRFALVEGILGAGSSFMKYRSDWAQSRSDQGGAS